MAREIILNAPQEVEVVAAQTVEVSALNLVYVADFGDKVEAQIQFSNGAKNYLLWDENTTPTYTEAGQWTDADVDARIKQLI